MPLKFVFPYEFSGVIYMLSYSIKILVFIMIENIHTMLSVECKSNKILCCVPNRCEASLAYRQSVQTTTSLSQTLGCDTQCCNSLQLSDVNVKRDP